MALDLIALSENIFHEWPEVFAQYFLNTLYDFSFADGGNGEIRMFLAKYTYDPMYHSPNKHPELELGLNFGDFVYVYGNVDEVRKINIIHSMYRKILIISQGLYLCLTISWQSHIQGEAIVGGHIFERYLMIVFEYEDFIFYVIVFM